MALIFQNLANIRVRTDDNGDLIVSPSAAGSTFLAVNGAAATPGFAFVNEVSSGLFLNAATDVRLSVGGNPQQRWFQNGTIWRNDAQVGFAPSSALASIDTIIARGNAASQLNFNGVNGAALTTTTFIKTTTGIADAAATATITVTVPNSAQSASVRVVLVGSLGAGGAVGANEASGTVAYDIAVTRTTGVNATAIISTAYGSAMTNEAGAATITVTAALSAISGAVGAVNTFTVNVTITKGGGTSTNHTCVTYTTVVNANASGCTLN
jgi:hypothetical protein